MTKTMKRFLKICTLIKTGKADEMKLYDFYQSLDAVQARELINDVDRHIHNKNEVYNFVDTLFPLLREDVAKEIIREGMRSLADRGFGRTPFLDNPKIARKAWNYRYYVN